MAGGIGSRFWPMSTPECPKQFIDVLGCGRTLLQLTADRFKRICFPENIWVVTSEAYADIVREQLPEIPESNILKEPCRRNTAPCIAYVSWRIKKLNPKANVVVTPSDHIVMDVAEFERVITSGLAFTAETDSILTLGMKPNRPETDDMREAPALVLIDKLLKAGCKVRAYDPAAVQECKRRIGDTIYYACDMYDAVLDADVLMLVTEWKEFRLPSWAVIKKTMSRQIVLDGRNIYDKKEMEELGFVYHCIGK